MTDANAKPLDIKPKFQCGTPGRMLPPQLLKLDNVLDEVFTERKKQTAKWGEQTHTPADWYTVLGEEFGEVGHAINEGDVLNYREELIQTAAVCVAMVESIDRQLERGYL